MKNAGIVTDISFIDAIFDQVELDEFNLAMMGFAIKKHIKDNPKRIYLDEYKQEK